MSDTGSDMTAAERGEETHGESHTSMSARNSRRKSHVDTSAVFPQVRNSHADGEKVTRPLPRKVTFSALSLGRAERDTERGEINKTTPGADGPEPVGAIAERVLDDLAARRAEVFAHLRRTLPPKEQQP